MKLGKNTANKESRKQNRQIHDMYLQVFRAYVLTNFSCLEHGDLMRFKACCIHSARMKEEGKKLCTRKFEKKNIEHIGAYTNSAKIYLQS